MQIDSEFASRIFERDLMSVASTGLVAEDLEWLLAADPRAVSADPGGRRRSQLLGNVVAEFTATVHFAVERLDLNDVVVAFASSPDFHSTIRLDGSLPIAFGAYVERRLLDMPDVVVSSILTLERTMALARRETRELKGRAAGEVTLAAHAWVIELAAGSFKLASGSLESVSGERARQISLGPDREVLLITSGAAAHVGALRAVQVELLSDAVAEVLLAAREPLGAEEQARLAKRRGVGAQELAEFLGSLIEEGLLLGGNP